MAGKILNSYFQLLLGILLFNSCNDIDSFGSDLLDTGWIHSKGVDSFHLVALPAPKDSTITFKNYSTLRSTNSSSPAFSIGKMDDPVFGTVNVGFGSQLRIIPSKDIDFLKSPIDSIVLSLRYDTNFFYGKYFEPMDIAVYPLFDPYNVVSTYYSNQKLEIDKTIKLGEKTNFVPNKKDSLQIKLLDTIELKLYPQLRFQLDTAAFMKIMRSYPDTVYFKADSFSKVFNGIAFVCEKGNGILSVLPEHADSKITIYYHNSLDQASFRDLNMGSLAVKTPYYDINNQNSFAGQCIDGTISGDSLLSLQGFEGRDMEIKIPYDSTWNNRFINYAYLQFYVAEPPGDDIANFPLPSLLEIFERNSGSKVVIDDVTLGLNSQSGYTKIFGGNPIKSELNGKSVYLYKMNITRHFQKSLRAKKDMNLIISPLYKLESAARLVFFGPGSKSAQAKLFLTFSE